MASQHLRAPYASIHENPQGPGDARPTALQIIKDEDLINKWSDRAVLITGGSSGLGIETARALHATGARVFITTRSLPAAEAVKADILATSPGKGDIEIIRMELDDLTSIQRAAEEFLAKSDTLNVLVNNAGVMAVPYAKTKDGFESTFGINHLAHFLFTQLLLPILIASSTPSFHSRVVNVSSQGHRYAVGGLSPKVLEDVMFEEGGYNEVLAYGRSKAANILHANGIERRYGYGEHPVHAFSLHPGGITTNLWRHMSKEQAKATEEEHWNIWKSPEQGAATQVWCAVAKVWEGKPGTYCHDCQEAVKLREEEWRNMNFGGAAPWVYEKDQEEKLWELSEELVREKYLD